MWASIAQIKITKFGWELLTSPPYSPDFSPSLRRPLILLIRLKNRNGLKNRKFETEDELRRYLKDFFDSKCEDFYASGICELGKIRGSKVINTNGKYIHYSTVKNGFILYFLFKSYLGYRCHIQIYPCVIVLNHFTCP